MGTVPVAKSQRLVENNQKVKLSIPRILSANSASCRYRPGGRGGSWPAAPGLKEKKSLLGVAISAFSLANFMLLGLTSHASQIL